MTNEELLQIIEQAAKEKATELDLSNNQLSSLPPEICQLTQLTELDLRNNQLSSLPPEICQLTSLKLLSLYNNQLSSLPLEFGQLSQLTKLYLHNNQISRLPSEFSQLTNMEVLSLNDNQLSSLPLEICQLTSLKVLSLYNNQLSSLPLEICQLSNLTKLSLLNNQLSSLPLEISQLSNLTRLSLDNNPQLTSPPPEIVEQGTQAILTYLRERLEGSLRQWVSKLLVVGEGGVGKTSLLRALRGEEFDTQESTTHGIEIKWLHLTHPRKAGTSIHLKTWDFGGQEIYHATHQFFLTNRSLFLLAWNARLGFEQGKLYYWLDIIKALAPESLILLVATHIDERDADLPLAELRRKYPQIVEHCKISSKISRGVEELRRAIAEAAAKLPLMGEIWPTTWLNAANAIRTQSKKYITPQQLWDIMAESQVTESQEVLARWLHELGEILYFQDNEELNDTVILKPQWVTEYISKALESEDVINRKGIFTRQEMNQLWRDLEPSMRDHFLHLMERFDLSYRTQENRDLSLVVERLPLDAPNYEQKWQQIKQTNECNEISMKFQLNTIPAGIPTWFIARQHRFTTGIHWRNGVLFAYEQEHLALVEAVKSDRYIKLTVRGPNPLNFFVLLRDGMEVTLARFPGLDIQRTIPCFGHNGQPCTHEFDYKQLSQRWEKKKGTIECPEAMEDVSVPELLYGLNWNTQNAVLERIDELEKTVVDGQAVILDEFKNLLELTQRGFTNAFRREQATIDSHCPNVFVLRPRGGKAWQKNLTGQKLDLQLYCQAPGCWHPTQEGGLYEINEPAKWLRVTAPYIGNLFKVLKYAAPIIGPWLGVVDPKEYETLFKNDLELFKELAAKLPELKESEDLELADKIARGEDLDPERADGAALRALRQLLQEKDPQQHWGGLKNVLTPEGHYLWLCEHHAAEYKR
ncbi:MAG: COR domain-containing protein [Nostoc sp. ChiQUE02]|uniref:COR domain-containing protein n=1 Tax=Nostoc sp. ChiQUE02 TaxID=3075377 RepID=UPI002AD34AA4|nr:COR domain-containing protein [Nostoc sp. ChiQUE02]MDZ8230357.1 COR domain-containing protein [Nostoc sp. ChiQUE02]